MIRELYLEDFGKFTDRTFPLGPVTVFFGPNEAGKTTIHDVLFDKICAPSGNTTEARYLNSRYGRDRRAEARSDGDLPRIDVDAFTSLHAVTSGNLKVAFDEGASWVDRVKADLFSGGIDPVPIRENLEKLGSDSGVYSHNRRLREVQTQLAQAEQDLAALQEKRQRILRGESRKAPLQKAIEDDGARLADLDRKRESLDADLANEEAVRWRLELEETLTDLDTHDRIREKRASLKAVDDDALGELDKRQSTLEALVSARADVSRKMADLRDRVEEARERVENRRQAVTEARRQAAAAEALRPEIAAYRDDPPLERETRWRPAMLVVAGVGGLGGLAFGYAAGSVLAVALGLVWAVLFGVFARQVTLLPSKEAAAEIFRDLKRRWTDAAGQDADVSSFEELERVLYAAEDKHASLAEALASAEDDLTDLTTRHEALVEEEKRIETDLEAAESDLQSWLAAYDVQDRDAFVTKLTESKLMADRIADLEKKLGNARAAHECDTLEDLRREVRRKLRDLDDEGVGRTGKSTHEIQQLKRERDDVARESAKLRDRIGQRDRELTAIEGEIKGSLGRLPEDLLQMERRISELKKEEEDLLLKREAAATAAKVFDRLSSRTDAVLNTLASEIEGAFGRIVGGERAVSITRFSEDGIQVIDAEGEERPLQAASGGTRDALWLAARLAMVRRSVEGRSLLIFDEPFPALDDFRLGRALDALGRFGRANDWQLVLMTKDEGLVRVAREVFDEDALVVHELG